jgi:DNA-binding LacI/PurR family transcriptional regulator
MQDVLALLPGQVPTALLMHNDMAAFGAIHAARECGWRVPQDISIVGFDDIALARYCTVPLTTVDMHIAQTGRLVIEILADLLCEGRSGDAAKLRQIVLPAELIVRDSTAPPRSSSTRFARRGAHTAKQLAAATT